MDFSHQTRRLLLAVLISVSSFRFSETASFAANNPLSPISADSYDSIHGGALLESSGDGGKHLASVHDSDYVVFRGYDFDSGVAGFSARIATPREGTIEVRLDGPTGVLLGSCSFASTGGWESWKNVACKVDNSQAGVRDVYLVFHGQSKRALVNLQSFKFSKTLVGQMNEALPNLAERIDAADDEVQSTNSWGMPEHGFTDDFQDGHLKNWIASGIVAAKDGFNQHYFAGSRNPNFNFALAPDAYINKTDTGGEWRTLAEGAVAADVTLDQPESRPGIGFSSKDGKRWIYAVLNSGNNSIEVWRNFGDGTPALVKSYGHSTNANWSVRPHVKFHLQLDWSPYSDGLIVFLMDQHSNVLANFRTVVDLPAARHPFMACSGGAARFENFSFDPAIDGWNFKWQWKKSPVLAPDVCNPAVWKGKNGRYYMMWRKFGQDTYHGIASSSNGINWTRISDKVLKCTGDMNVLVDPFGDGLTYITPGGNKMAWYASDGSADYTEWKDTGKNLGDIFGNSRIQEIIDTARYPMIKPIRFQNADYRFIGFTENWVNRPQPHTVVLLSNTLTNWVLADSQPLLPPRADFWGEKGSAIGSAMVLPDGNILLASCSCTFAGYTGAPEPSNVSVIVDGKQPWKVLKTGILPDAPVSRENVWYQGPNFGTAFYYTPENDTLFYYGGFHDFSVGLMRVENFSKSKIFGGNSLVAKIHLADQKDMTLSK